MQKSLFVIPEVFIGNPVFFKIKDFWIPAFAGMTTMAILSILLQEAQGNIDVMIGFFKKKNKESSGSKNHKQISNYIKPSFLIIGAQKAGTTALFNYLKKHYCILPSNIKEIDFFNCKSRFNNGIDFYHSHFPLAGNDNKGKISFEATPGYLANPFAPERIFKYNSSLKLIALLREPVKRTFSAWNMYKKYYKDNKNWFHDWMTRCEEEFKCDSLVRRNLEKFNFFDLAIKEELLVLEQNERIEVPILMHGKYCEQFERYFNFFNKSQILILENNEFKLNTITVLKRDRKSVV